MVTAAFSTSPRDELDTAFLRVAWPFELAWPFEPTAACPLECGRPFDPATCPLEYARPFDSATCPLPAGALLGFLAWRVRVLPGFNNPVTRSTTSFRVWVL